MNLIIKKPIGGLGTGQRQGWGLYFKNTHDYRNKIFNKEVCIIRGDQWGFQNRFGLGMKWSSRPRTRIGWGLHCNRLNSPPKINNLFSMIFLWSFVWKEGRTLLSKATGRNTHYSQFYKYLSLRIIIEGAINYVRRKRAYRNCTPVGYRNYESKGLVCSLLGY
ncbi:hypothetical protein [uncultured Mediterranean phage uvMED]|nr:hypothetical protein [uncultured Mediterranean phage uvMED]BAQ87042.1 hypothetical protein [uncultured Mediterranean phage uvMED]BAQ87097.1 hypothetical protein [uncultured Mediterranean phage uvMED]BAR16594.1 hypothetical protein [uncultured Mediterranean phage uvMED]BAR16679.1 hypothetical protein [uncultured Mediterranean phage uvMED]